MVKNNSTTPAAHGRISPQPVRRMRYSPMTMALEAAENPLVIMISPQPVTNPATGPKASRV